MTAKPSRAAAELDTREWNLLATTLREFEDARRNGETREFQHYLPPEDSVLRHSILVELIKVDQEYTWDTAPGRYLESYLAEWPELVESPHLLAELLRAECLTRAVCQDPLTEDELLSRFPEIADQIDLPTIMKEAEDEGKQARVREHETGTHSAPDISTPAMEAPPRSLHAGEKIGERYEIREIIGVGGMGTVYRAHDSKLDTEVAIKVPHSTSDADVFSRLQAEARSMVKLRHPNICPIFDIGQTNGVHYISMALIEGCPLDQWLETRQLAPIEAAVLVCRVASALAAVHDAGILHRDVKASNIMMDEQGEPILTDFGLAREIHDDGLVSGSAFSGTPAYMAPQQVQGEAADQQSDVFSLGVILYQLLAGRLPFEGPFPALVAQILECRPAKPSVFRNDLDTSIEAICLKALARNLDERFQTARDLVKALEEYIQQKSHPRKKRPRIVSKVNAVGFAVFLLLLAGSVIVLKTGNGTVRIVLNDPNTTVTIDGEVFEIDHPGGSVSVTVGRHELKVEKDGFRTDTRSFTIGFRGATEDVRVTLIPSSDDRSREKEITAIRWIETGEAAMGITFSNDGTRAYVPCWRGEQDDSPIRVFQVPSGQELPSIPLQRNGRLGNPHADVVLSPDGGFLYTVNYYGRSLSVVNLKSGETQEVDLVSDPRYFNTWAGQIAITADGRRLVVTRGSDGNPKRPNDPSDDYVSLFDISGGSCTLVGNVALEDEPLAVQRGLSLSSDGRFAYVATMPRKSPEATIYEISLQRPYKVTRTLSIPEGNLTGVALHEKDNQLLVGDRASRRIWRIDLESFKTVSEIRLAGHAPETLVVCDKMGLLFALCPTTRRLFCIALENGTTLATVDELRERMVDLSLRNEVELWLASGSPEGGLAVIKLADLLTRIAFASNRDEGNFQIFSANALGADIVRLTDNLFTERFPRWSPDGKQLAYVSDRAGPPRICLMDSKGGEPIILEDTDPILASAQSAPLDWSPDGKEIAFIGDDRKAIRVVSVADHTLRTVLDGTSDSRSAYMTSLSWRQTDGAILFGSQPPTWGHGHEIYALDPQNSAVTQLTDDHGAQGFWAQPSASPDGEWITMIRQDNGVPVLFINAGGKREPKSLSSEEGVIHASPEWFPDCERIVCSAKKTEHFALWLYSVDGGTPRVLTGGDWDDMDPDVCTLSSLRGTTSNPQPK